MKKIAIIAGLLSLLTSSVFTMDHSKEVNIFSARHYDSDVQLYEKFTDKTGIKVNVVSGKSGALEKRIIEEGAESKADLYITADAGRLGAFDAKGMLQSGLSTSKIKSAVPSNFRTSKWTGIAKRARIVYFSPERVTGKHLWIGILLFFFVGIYGGFIQAGVGFIMLLVLSSINNMSLVKSNAIKVFVALIYSLAAVAIFAYNDSINWVYGIILAIGNRIFINPIH